MSDGYVYAIQAGFNGPVKFGWAKNPRLRMRAFQTGHFDDLALLAFCRGSLLNEQALHRSLRQTEWHMRGEWYSWNDRMVIVPFSMVYATQSGSWSSFWTSLQIMTSRPDALAPGVTHEELYQHIWDNAEHLGKPARFS